MFGIAWRWSVCCVLLCLVSALLVRAEEIPAEHQPIRFHRRDRRSRGFGHENSVPVSQVTSAVEVITAQDMKKQNIRSVVDALRLAQGLAVFSSGGPGTEVSARIRGGSSSQTLVLIDGAIVNSATLGSYDFANLTTDNIERVEILRGAQSMLWGSDAMGASSISSRSEARPH